MAMLVYSTLDIFDEKQRVLYNIEGETKFNCYLGLLMETFMS